MDAVIHREGVRGVSKGLKTTFDLLAKTRNEAAVRVLLPALDAVSDTIREAALTAILKRRNPAGHREVLRRLHAFDDRSRDIIHQHSGRLTNALRAAVLGADKHLRENGCHAAVWFREYDLIPALINSLEDQSSHDRDLAGRTLLELVELLYGELAGPKQNDRRRDPQMVRRHVLGSLEHSVERYLTHQRREMVEAYVLLVNRDSAILNKLLDDPHHPAFLVLVDVLSKSTASGVIGLLLAFLDNRRAPTSVLSLIAKRDDFKFVEYLLRKIGHEPSVAVRQNLKKISSVAWLQDTKMLDQLDDAAQHSVVRLAMLSNVPRARAFDTVAYILQQGKPRGRRAAAEALNEFNGAEANALVEKFSEDDDPQVQASALVQLRRRGILKSLTRLVQNINSEHAVVRDAARAGLTEFSFQRFLAAFDMLDDDVRRSTGSLVRKVDPQTIPMLQAEMESHVRTRRLRALEIAQAIEAVVQLDRTIIGLTADEDHLVRAEAAKALGESDSPASCSALEGALDDGSHTVRESARKSLNKRAIPSRPAARHNPQDSHWGTQ